MGIFRAWITGESEDERALAAESRADAAKARNRLAELERERRSGNCDPDWYAQERDRAADNLDYALGRGPYKE